MTTLLNIQNIFNIFHDGTIETWNGDKSKLTLKISCLYLAQRINKSYEYFYLELINIDTITLNPWTIPIDAQDIIKTNLQEIFETELEILNAEIENGSVEISVAQSNSNINYSGGILTLNCQEIKIYDHQKVLINLEYLEDICNQYWDGFGKK